MFPWGSENKPMEQGATTSSLPLGMDFFSNFILFLLLSKETPFLLLLLLFATCSPDKMIMLRQRHHITYIS